MNILTLTLQSGESGTAHITAAGEVDLSTAQKFRQLVLPAAMTGPVALDMTRVDFLDSAGMMVLMDAAKLTGRDGCLVRVRATAQPAKALTLARFDAILQIEIQEAGG